MSERVEGSRIRLLIQYNNEIDKDFLALPTNEVCFYAFKSLYIFVNI